MTQRHEGDLRVHFHPLVASVLLICCFESHSLATVCFKEKCATAKSIIYVPPRQWPPRLAIICFCVVCPFTHTYIRSVLVSVFWGYFLHLVQTSTGIYGGPRVALGVAWLHFECSFKITIAFLKIFSRNDITTRGHSFIERKKSSIKRV